MAVSVSQRSKCGKWVLAAGQRLLDCRAGTFAVEFALATPIMLLLIVAVADVSLMMYRKIEINNAAKLASHYGLLRRPVQGDLTAIESAARNNLPADWFAGGTSAPATVTASLACVCEDGTVIACTNVCSAGQLRATYLNVDVTKLQPTLFDYPVFPGSVLLSVRSSVRLQ